MILYSTDTTVLEGSVAVVRTCECIASTRISQFQQTNYAKLDQSLGNLY